MKQSKEVEAVDKTIGDLLDKIYKQHITDISVLPLILCNEKKQVENLTVIDCLYQSVQTSLQFGQYRRAVWYLQAFSLACNKTFGDNNRQNVVQLLQKRMTEARV